MWVWSLQCNFLQVRQQLQLFQEEKVGFEGEQQALGTHANSATATKGSNIKVDIYFNSIGYINIYLDQVHRIHFVKKKILINEQIANKHFFNENLSSKFNNPVEKVIFIAFLLYSNDCLLFRKVMLAFLCCMTRVGPEFSCKFRFSLHFKILG